MNWPVLISKIAMIKSKTYEKDGGKIWPYHLPNVKASEKQMEDFIRRIKISLPSDYLEFLRHANGWKGFFQYNDLLGTEDHQKIQYQKTMDNIFFSLEEANIPGIEKKSLFPIAVNSVDRDIFFIVAEPTKRFGKVIWYAGQVIETFSDFSAFMNAMIAYNERELKRIDKLKESVIPKERKN
jgi:hypothetical protein